MIKIGDKFICTANRFYVIYTVKDFYDNDPALMLDMHGKSALLPFFVYTSVLLNVKCNSRRQMI